MAIAPVVIEFLAKGMPQVQQAFQSIGVAAAKAAKAQITEAEKAAGAVDKIESNALKGRLRMQRQMLDQEKAGRARALSTRLGMLKREYDEERKTQKRINEAKLSDQKQAWVKEQNAARRVNEQKLNAQKAAWRQEQTDAQRINEDRLNRQKAAWRTQQGLDEKARRDAVKGNVPLGRFTETVLGSAARATVAGLRRSVAMGTALATTAAQLGGGFSIADSVRSQGEFDLEARRLVNATKENERPDLALVKTKARAAAISTNTDAADLVRGTHAYVAKSGDATGGIANMEFFGKLGKATNTSVEDVGSAAGVLRVQNKNLSPEAMRAALFHVVQQGKEGSVEFEHLADMIGKATKSSSAYAVKQAQAQVSLAGLTQIAMRSSGKDPSEAATTISNVSMDAITHADKVEKLLGRKFLNDKGQIDSSPEKFIADVMTAADGNMQKIRLAGFQNRSYRMFQALAPVFNDAGGGAAGRKAIEKDMASVTDATYTTSQLERDLSFVKDAPTEKFAAAMRELQMEAGEKLLPVFQEMLPTIRELIPLFVDMARTGIPAFTELMKSVSAVAKKFEWLIQDVAAHPVGALIAFELTKSFHEAMLPALLRGLLTGAFSGAGVGVPGATPGVAGGVPGAPGAPPVSPLAGTAVTLGAVAQVGAMLKTYSDVQESSFAGRKWAGDVAKMDPEQAAAEVEKARRASEGGATASAWADIALRGLNAGTNLPGFAAQMLGDSIGEALTGKSTLDSTKDAIKADAMLAALQTIAANTDPKNGGGGNSGSGGDGRGETILNRSH